MALQMVAVRLFLLLAVLHSSRASSGFCHQVVEPLGYGCAEFTVQTRDGFVLALHRLSKTHSLTSTSGNIDSGARSSPAGAPVFPPTAGDRNDDDVSEASGPAPSPTTVLRIDSSIYNSTELAVEFNVSAHFHAPMPTSGIRGIRSQDSSPANSSVQDREGRLPYSSTGPSSQSTSLDRTSSNRPSELREASLGPAPTVSQVPLRSTSTHSDRTTGNGSPSNYTAGKGAPVLLLHQEFASGEIWFESADGNQSISNLLPIMLLNDGFDVWIGHSRATYWGHGHVYFTSTDREYWNWTWDAHVEFDLPAQLLFISSTTKQPVHIVGASQAATVGTAAATDHESAQMIRSLTLIGPTVYRGYTSSRLLEAWAYYFGLTLDSEYLVTGFQDGAFNYSMEFPESGPFSAQGLSGTAIDLISGPNCCLSDSAPIQFTNGWDGTTSFKNLLHWQQGIRMNTFAHYDYGNAARNRLAYGRPVPPRYYVAQIPRRMPVLIIAGGQDYEAPPQGIRLLLSQLQQPAVCINLTNYAHYDLGFSVYRQADIYLPILIYLEGPKFQ